MMLFGIEDPKRLLPFAQFLIAILVHLIVYISFYHFCSPHVPVPKYLVDSPMIDTFSNEGVKFVEVMSATVGCMLIADIIIEMSLYWGTSKFGTRRSRAVDGEVWPSDVFLDHVKEWCIRLLVAIFITIPSGVLLNVRMDDYFIVYAMGMRAIRYHSLAAATLFVVCDTLDRSWFQFASTTSTNLMYGMSELTYSFLSLQEQSSTTTTVLSIVKPLRLVLYSITSIRVLNHYFVLFRSLWNSNSELRLRRLTVKDWKFLAYSSMFLVSFGVVIGTTASKNFTYYMLTPRDHIILQIFVTILAVISTLMPLAMSRYEVARAQNVSYYAEQKVMRAVNDPLREAVAELDKLIEHEQETSDVHNSSRLQSLLKIALACHAAVGILEQDVRRLERDDADNKQGALLDSTTQATSPGSNDISVCLMRTTDGSGNMSNRQDQSSNGICAHDNRPDIEAGGLLKPRTQDETNFDLDGVYRAMSSRHLLPHHNSNKAVTLLSQPRNRQKKHTFKQRRLYLPQHHDCDHRTDYLHNERKYEMFNHYSEETATLRSKQSKLSSVSNVLSSITRERSVTEVDNVRDIDVDALISRAFERRRFEGRRFANNQSEHIKIHTPFVIENNATRIEVSEERDGRDSRTEDLIKGMNELNADHYVSDTSADTVATSRVRANFRCELRKSPNSPRFDLNKPGPMKEHDFRPYGSTSLQAIAPAVSSILSVSTVSKSALQSENLIMPQGIGCYCFGDYKAAAEALLVELEVAEGVRLHSNCSDNIWPSDLRLWLCAALNKLQKCDGIQIVLNHPAKIRASEALVALSGTGTGTDSGAYRGSSLVVRQRLFMGVLMSFYAGECSVDEVVEFAEKLAAGDDDGNSNSNINSSGCDRFRFKFFCYFYLGLYYDSIGDQVMAAFTLPQVLKHRGIEDMWYMIALFLSRRNKL